MGIRKIIFFDKSVSTLKFYPATLMKLVSLVFMTLTFSSNVIAYEDGKTGSSVSGCSSSGCHGFTTEPVGPYRYTGSIWGDASGSWSTATQTIENTGTFNLIFFLNKDLGSNAVRFGMDMSTSGGTLSETSGTLKLSSSEITHTAPDTTSCVSGGPDGCDSGDKQFTSISWAPPASSSGDFVISACGNPVNFDGSADIGDSDSTGGLCSTISVAVRPNVAGWAGPGATYSEGDGYTVIDSAYTQTAANLNRALVTLTNWQTGDELACPASGTTGISCAVSGPNNTVVTFTPSSGTDFFEASFETAVQGTRFRNTSQNPSTTPREVTLVVRDGDNNSSTTDTATIAVAAVNDAPVIPSDPVAVGMSEDGFPTAFSLTLNATDPENDNLTWDILTQPDTGEGTAQTTAGTGNSNEIDYFPPDNYTGTTSFVVRVTDDGTGMLTDTITVNVTVEAVNDPPEIESGATEVDVTMSEDGSPMAFSLSLNAVDVDGDTITWSISSNPNMGGSAGAGGPGTSAVITYIPTEHFYGSESFIVEATAAALSDFITVNVTVQSVNDPPIIAAINNQTATEDIAFSLDAGAGFDDADHTNNGTDITWTFQSGQQTGMTISSFGVIDWTPPQTETFEQSYGPVVVRATDGALADTESFSILVSPPDGDSDQVADYNDLCLTISDPTNADNDGDGTAGSDGGANDGGDVCDLDDDNDGMPDDFEDTYGLDPFNAADADGDTDGDGVSNLDEYLDGTSPGFADKVFDATGYYTPIALTPPDPKSIHAAATGVRADNLGPYRPGKTKVSWTAFNSSNDNLGTVFETLKINPILSFAANQLTAEGSTVTVAVSLNGPAHTYPVEVNYSVSGTAGTDDHDAESGSFEIADPDRATSFTFNVTQDATAEGEATVLFTFTDASNAVIGNRSSHVVTIVEGNVLPQVELRLQQSGAYVSSAFVSEGLVTVEATVTDVNSDQTHSLDWSSTDNSLVAPTNSSTSSWTFTPAAGNFLIDVEVTDSGSPALSNRVSRVLNIAAAASVLTDDDSDGDGTNDDVEGFGDGDSDGVPDYLDANDGASGEANLIANQTVDFSTSYLLETEPGLTLSLGNTALAANNFGALVTDSDIRNFGSSAGGRPLGASDDFEHIGGVHDFQVKGMAPAAVVSVVIPLQSAIPANAEYRKFHFDRGWVEFVVDENNQIASASGELGACPEPGSELYESGLNYLYNCLQLTIEDGGPNDTDGIANGVIKDPGSVGVELSDATIPEVEGGGRLHPLMLLWLLSLLVFHYLSRFPLREKSH